MDLHEQLFLGIIDPKQFFNRDVQEVGKDLLGKIIQHNVDGIWISGIVLLRVQSSLSIFAPKLFINAKILILKDKIPYFGDIYPRVKQVTSNSNKG